jgi:hypothetical protein
VERFEDPRREADNGRRERDPDGEPRESRYRRIITRWLPVCPAESRARTK